MSPVQNYASDRHSNNVLVRIVIGLFIALAVYLFAANNTDASYEEQIHSVRKE